MTAVPLPGWPRRYGWPSQRQLLARRLVPLPPKPPRARRRRCSGGDRAGGDPGPLHRPLRRRQHRPDGHARRRQRAPPARDRSAGPGHPDQGDLGRQDLDDRRHRGAAIGLAIGVPLGIIAGWFGGIFDWFALRLFELFTMVPTILAALLFITVFGVSVWKLALFIGITLWVGFGRLARAQYLALRDRDFVLAARATGVPAWRIIIVHILPNAIGPIIVFFVQQVPYVIFTAAGFSFLGLGVQDPLADWGKMINDSVIYLPIDPLLVLVPIGCIGLACLSFSFLGDGLRDALDPTSR